MQYLLKNNRFFNSTQTPGEAFSPFENVSQPSISSGKISTTNAASSSPIANEFQAEKQSISSQSFISSTSMQFLNFCNKRGYTSIWVIIQQQSRATEISAEKVSTLFPIFGGHPIHNFEASSRSHLPWSIQEQWWSRIPVKIQPLYRLWHLRAKQ